MKRSLPLLVVAWLLLGQSSGVEPIRGDPPTVYAYREGTNIVVTWIGNSLQGATSLRGPWSTVTTSTNRYSEPLQSQPVRFFRASS
jgi:hypothetical protein